jgi:hypothetical protein
MFDPPDGAPRPAARRLALSPAAPPPSRLANPSLWRGPKRVSVSLWSAAAERPLPRRLAA